MSGESNWSDEDLKELLKLFGQHLVAICGAYVTKDEDGKPLSEKFFSYTGFIISTGGHWFIVTAGHCLDKLKEAHEHEQIEITGRVLADCFGPDVPSKAPIPFDVMDEPRIHIDDPKLGLDIGLVYLRPYYRNLLKANNISPAPFRREDIDDYGQFYGFSIVGFPDERTETVSSETSSPAVGAVVPTLVPIRLDVEAPTDDCPFPRLVGHPADMGDLESIKGISGGPMLAYQEDGDRTAYEVIGVQSRWLKGEQKTFGCPMLPFLQLVNSLAKVKQLLEERADDADGNQH